VRVLITGAAGLLGAAIAETVSRTADVTAVPRDALDVTRADAVRALVERERPDAIVNCAAYNDVDGAEANALLALDVNATAVLHLARAARAVGAILVHYSTDFVFDGEHDRPYAEEDPVNPRSVYGASKLLGEWFAADAGRHYVLRVESLFGGPGEESGARRGSLGTMVGRIRNGEPVPVFTDRVVSPTLTIDVAAATEALLVRGGPYGTYHCVNSGAATWQEVARYAADRLGVPLDARPLTLATASLIARRPRYCALSPARLAALGIPMPTWQDAVARYLQPSPTARPLGAT
jgi:dTDP-4-dehydrorhamnose reductase